MSFSELPDGFNAPKVESSRGFAARSVPPIDVPSPFDRFIFFPLICGYIVFAHFSSVTRFIDFGPITGLSTVMILAICAVGIRRAVDSLFGSLMFPMLLLLFLYWAIPSSLGDDAANDAVVLVVMIGYVIAAAAISASPFSQSQLSILWRTIAVSLLISSGLAAIDVLGILKIPYVNEAFIDTAVEVSAMQRASGFFPTRSAMAAYYAPGIAGCLVLSLSRRGWIWRLIFAASAAAGLVSLFLSQNRSGVFAPLFAIGLYVMFGRRFGQVQRVRLLALLGIGGFIGVVFAYYYQPDVFDFYLSRLGFIGLADSLNASDLYRVNLFVEAVTSIGSNPLGNGFSKIPLDGELKAAHNIITEIIWGTGIFAFLWLPLFVVVQFVFFSRKLSGVKGAPRVDWPERDALGVALFSFLLHCMTHASLSTALAWILFGIAVSVQASARKEARQAEILAAQG